MTNFNRKKIINSFRKKGIIEFNQLLNKKKCSDLYKKIIKSRLWGNNLFKSEKVFQKKQQFKRTNPGKGKFNLAEKFDLNFIENNKEIKSILNDILGKDYEIVIKKFVVAVPESWIPNWLKQKVKNSLAPNLGPFIKNKYRDVTYFRGIDYHMDQIDFPNQPSDFITLYIYLNDTTSKMSPLNILEGSHIFGQTKFPHIIKKCQNNNYLKYGNKSNNLKIFKKKRLIGKSGTVYIWSSLTLHGTQPQENKDDFRISLRYIIKKSNKVCKNTEINNLIKNISPIRIMRDDVDPKNFKQIKFDKILR